MNENRIHLPVTEEQRQALAARHFAPGTQVICIYRMPSVIQSWIHPIYVGVVEEPDDDPATWNGKNSERHYCETCGLTKVRWDFGQDGNGQQVDHAHTYGLFEISAQEAALTPLQKVRLFLGEEAYQNWLAVDSDARAHAEAGEEGYV